MQCVLFVLGCCMLGATLAAPLTYHDQRQHGDFNLHGRVHNIVVFIIPTSGLSLFDFIPYRQRQDARNFYRNREYHQDNVIASRHPVMEEKSFQVDEEIMVDEPVELSLDKGVKSFQEVEEPVDISLEQVKKAKVISTTLKKTEKEVPKFGGAKSVGSLSNVGQEAIVVPDIQEEKIMSVVDMSLSGRQITRVSGIEKEEVKSVIGLPSTSGQMTGVSDIEKEAKSVAGMPLSSGQRLVVSVNPKEEAKSVLGLPPSVKVKGVKGLPSTSEEDTHRMSEIVPTETVGLVKVDRRLDVDVESTDDRTALNERVEVKSVLTSALAEKIKQLSAGIEICSPDQRRDDEGNCQTIKHEHRSGQHFDFGGHAGVNRVNPALGFGLSPANE